MVVLSEQRQQLSTALRQAEDKVEALQHEKLFLVQEKAELVGSLKQLQHVRVTTAALQRLARTMTNILPVRNIDENKGLI